MAESPTTAPRPGWSWHRLTALFVVLLILPSLLVPGEMPADAPPARAIALGVLLGHGAWLAIALLALRLQVGWRAIPAELGLARLSRADLRVALRMTAVALPLVWLCLLATGLVWYGLDRKPPANPLINWLGQAPGLTVGVIAATAVIVAPVVEELVFRVACYRTAVSWLSPQAAAVVVSLAFAASHGSLVQLPALFVLALALQEALRRTGNLWVPILIHALFNGVMVGLTLLVRAAPTP
jgi:membrane protease YdiL (CAAX protease family)